MHPSTEGLEVLFVVLHVVQWARQGERSPGWKALRGAGSPKA